MVRPILKAKNVVKRYTIGAREVEILHDLDIEIYPGEFVMLIGPSGCGKTTFMLSLFGIEPPTSGSIIYRGKNLFAISDRERTDLRSTEMTMIHQQPIWIKSLTVRENVAFPLLLQRGNKKQALEKADIMLDSLNLNRLANLHPHELSVGEQQRCSLMRSLIINPDLIFADEPTGSLDTDGATVVMEMFRKINEQMGKTIILVTHNLRHLPYASRVVSMLDGRLIGSEKKREPGIATSDKNIIEVVSSWKTAANQNDQETEDLEPIIDVTKEWNR